MKKLNKVCEVCGGKFHASFKKGKKIMYLCSKHQKHMMRYGMIRARTLADKNEVINLGLKSEVVLYNRKSQSIHRAIIDSMYAKIVKNYKWTGIKKGKSIYVKTDKRIKGHRKTIYLPTLILGQKRGFQIDHINGDTLDNRKVNLRFVTQQQNLMNKSRALGYGKEKRTGLWHTYIGVNKIRIQLGRFKTEKEAKEVRRKAELKYYGKFAKVN